MPYTQVWDPDSPADALVRIAQRQHGNVTVAQLHECGYGQAAIHRLCAQKRLFRVHHGVYALGRPPSLPLEHAAAAVLACGPAAALSHESAFVLWGFASRWRFPLHVTAAHRRKRPGIITHRAATLTRPDTRIQLGIRATSPARTLLDHAPALPDRQLRRAAAHARREGLMHPAALLDLLERNPWHPGAQALRATITDQAPTRSEFEDAFLVFCAHHGLPTPLVNTRVAGHEADAYFPESGLIVELDGWDFHRDRDAFEGDRERSADALAEAAAPTLHITWERMTRRADREAQRLQRILSRLGAEQARKARAA
ncbi:MAG TPA: type IV toxin-antitoxin system AbiEi family antitoxin domain-containing protein [Solirubrobacteraceae bacterium]